MAHPTRLQVLVALGERPATPRQVASEIGEPLNNVCYHVDVLRRLDCIELVSVGEAQGGRVAERVYRATQPALVDNDAWEELDFDQKLTVYVEILRMMGQDLEEAILGGTIMDPNDHHMSRTPMVVDEEGWREVIELLDSNLEPLQEIKRRSARRQAKKPTKTFPIKVEILQFRSPDPAG
jgi:DNA-binding transcriptional ArsR family regulator